MKELELLIPPPVIAMMAMMAMLIMNGYIAEPIFPQLMHWLILLAALAIGGVIALISVFQFRKVQTTVEPYAPHSTTTLVTNGVFRLTRNPMYLSLAIFWVGIVGLMGNAWLLIWVLFFIVYVTRFQIMPEEHALERKFGEKYAMYKQQVRRWI